MGRSNSFSELETKIQWLLKHHIFLVGKDIPKRKIVLAMKRDGLVSRLTYWRDVDVTTAVRQARIRWYASHNRTAQEKGEKG